MRKYSITRSQLNIPNANVNFKELFNKTKAVLADLSYDVDDTAYKFQKKGDIIKEVLSDIQGVKNVDDYARFVISVQIIIENAKAIKKGNETILEGKNGKIIFLAEIVLDYDRKWDKNPFLHFMKGLYERYIYINTRKSYEVKVIKEMNIVRNKIKNLVNMK